MMKMKKKTVMIAGGTAAALLIAGGAVYMLKGGSSADSSGVYVESVSDLTGNMIYVQKFSGVVKEQDSVSVKKDSAKTVAELYVEEGQTVKAGDSLFKYDVTEAQQNMQAANLEIEEINNEIEALNDEITELSNERSKVSEDEKFDYTSKISSDEVQIRQYQYDLQSKQADITRYQQEINNAVVKSTVSGTIKAVNEQGGYDSSGNEKPYISISQSGEFRVKGLLDEMSLGTLTAGQTVIIRSRVDENETWGGTVTEISTEPESSDNSYYYSSGDNSSKYPFYVSMNISEGLLLGQHVFIEPDYGQGSVQDGIWLDESFIAYDEDGNPYVWTSVKGKLKKSSVELGDTNDEMWTVEILSGLSEEDYIAWPSDEYTEGMKTVSDTAGE